MKRGLDIPAAIGLAIVLSPLIALIGLIIWLTSRGAPFFGHKRVGRFGRPFRCWKFRTMYSDAEERLHADPDLYARYVANHYKLPEGEDPRITPVGRFLRKTSLDELPQIINVLYGEMSFVGPRPVVTAEIDEYGSDAVAVLTAYPGITGLWQVSGRSRIGYPERADIELRYVREWTVASDLRILLKTIPAALTGHGAH